MAEFIDDAATVIQPYLEELKSQSPKNNLNDSKKADSTKKEDSQIMNFPQADALATPAAKPTADRSNDWGLGHLLKRFSAFVFDLVFCAAIFVAVMVLISRLDNIHLFKTFQLSDLPSLLAIAATILLSFLYFVLFEALFSRTPGKMIFGLKTQTIGKNRCGFSASMGRNLTLPLDLATAGLGGLIFSLKQKKLRRLGDIIGKTEVVGRFSVLNFIFGTILWAGGVAAAIYSFYQFNDGFNFDGFFFL